MLGVIIMPNVKVPIKQYIDLFNHTIMTLILCDLGITGLICMNVPWGIHFSADEQI